MLQFVERAIQFLGRISTLLAMISMALLVVLIAANILSRLAAISIPSVDDMAAVLLAAALSFGLAAAASTNQHLSITLLVDRVPERPRWYLVRATEALTIAVTAYLLVGICHLFGSAFHSGQKMLGALPIPRYLPMGMVMAGVALFVLVLTFCFIRNLFFGPTTAGEH